MYVLTIFGIFYLLRGVHYLNHLFSAPNDVIWSKRKDGIVYSLVSRTFTFLVCFQFQSPWDICWGKAIDMYKKISLLILGTFFTSFFVLNECVSTFFFLINVCKSPTYMSLNLFDHIVYQYYRLTCIEFRQNIWKKNARNYLNWYRKDKSLILLPI